MRKGGGIFTFFLILTGVSLLFDWYVFSGLRTLSADWQTRWRLLLTWGYLAISVGVTATLIFTIAFTDTSQGFTIFHMWVISLFLTLLMSKIFFVIILFLGDAGRFFAGLARGITGNSTTPFFQTRRRFVSELAVLAAALPLAGSFYGMIRGKYRYKTHKHTIHFDDLPDAFDGFTITQISDVHAGSFDNVHALQKGIDRIKALKSDLFVFTGDLVNNHAHEIEPYIDRFAAINAPYGKFSILGNHDYADYIQWDDAEAKEQNLEKLKQHHKDMGFRLLLDEAVPLEKDGKKIYLLGVQNWGRGFKQVGDIDHTLKQVSDIESFKVLLSHDPTHWEEKIRYHETPIHLTLSGHTHGAQFGVETPSFRWSPVKYRYLQWAGFARHKNRHLYVNRGFGFLGYTGRLGIWPEITVITLKKT